MLQVKKESVRANYFFRTVYQLLLYLVPLFVAPYLTRTLGDEKLGIFSYANSICSYFIVAANLGIANYGQREIAGAKNEGEDLRKSFWSLAIDHLVTSVLSLAVYAILAFTVFRKDGYVYPLAMIYVASAVVDISWLFYGLENFKIATIFKGINTFVKAGLIFALVKSPDDLWIYMLLTFTGTFLSNAVLIPLAIKTVKPIKITWHDCKRHLLPLLYFSVVSIAVTLYTYFDKTLLGLMVNKQNVAYYDYADKIISIPKMIVNGIVVVLFPKICNFIAQGKDEEAMKYIDVSTMITTFLSIGSCFGLVAIGKPLAVLYYGESFATSGDALMLMAPLIYIVCIGDIFRSEFMVPHNNDVPFMIFIVISAVLNLILSASLIPFLGIFGAIIGTMAAELFGTIAEAIYCRKYINPWLIFKPLIPFSIIGVAMFGIIKLYDHFMPMSILNLIVEIIIGFAFYVLFSALYVLLLSKNKTFYREKIKGLLHRGK